MNVLITGANGFIGKNLGYFLKELNFNIIGIDRKKYDNPFLSEFYHNDVRNSDIIRWICENEDVNTFIHLAADSGVPQSLESPLGNFSTNVWGTLLCLEGAYKAGVKKFIFSSSGGTVLGHQNPPVHENTVSCPASPYGASKVAAEAYCQAYAESFDMTTTILRFSNVFGPYSSHKEGTLIPSFFNAVFNNDKMNIYGDGYQTRDFIYVKDICNAILKCIEAEDKDIKGQIFQLGHGVEVPINVIVYILNQIIYNYLNEYVECNYLGTLREGDVRRNYVLPEKAERVLGWKPKYSLQEGLQETFEWRRKIFNYGEE